MTSLLLSTIFLISVLPLAQDARETFWQEFRLAVTNRNVEAVARLSQFPIGMSYGIPTVKTKAQLAKRFRQVFNDQTDGAACFSKAKPEMDPGNARAFT